MREIEYRGKRIDNNEWLYGDYLRFNNGAVIIPHIEIDDMLDVEKLEVVPETVSQFIGIKDIHGKKVFRGHIVKVKEIAYTDCSREEIEEVREFTGEIVWYQYSWHVAERVEDKIMKKIIGDTNYHSLWLWNINCDEGEEDDTMEILGNRWDNPEMRVIK